MKIIAIDYGDVRTGIAICDPLEILASPVCVIKEPNFNEAVKKITEEILNNQAQEVVIGYPKNMDGTIGERAKKSEMLVDELKKRLPKDMPIILWDERNTTKSANFFLGQNNIYKQKRKNMVDKVAATIILESYMSFKKRRKRKNMQ